ncbi:MAG: hypothetical protein QJR12_11210 [Mycobacterium sp.]|uniref:hypothetical protein n=1 Tax=Mycobacterium sp. TaxID=1785 RepID=UPI00260330AE|nr:hypothetical protein [Mycobacterium sp.]MDI3314809.1 hypothetical protein [Mycobacterium sp.]
MSRILQRFAEHRDMPLTPAKYTGPPGPPGYGLDRVAPRCGVTADNLRYLRSKRDKLGPLLDLPEDLPDDVYRAPR